MTVNSTSGCSAVSDSRNGRPAHRGSSLGQSAGGASVGLGFPEGETEGGALFGAALGYVARGLAVFPCQPGGKAPYGPLVRHGFRDASSDREKVAEWWRRMPDANIGIATGISFDVLDVDSPEALNLLLADSPSGAVLSDVPTVRTPRGWHFYFLPTGRGSSVRVGGRAGVDWRGIGGYVVAPPSRNSNGGTWSWLERQEEGTVFSIAPNQIPGWLSVSLEPRGSRADAGRGPQRQLRGHSFGPAVLDRELRRLALARPGTRNYELNRAAFVLGRRVSDGILTASDVKAGLVRVALDLGLSAHEVKRTIESGFGAGSGLIGRGVHDG